MKWTTFLLYLSAFYVSYYFLNILFDLYKSKRAGPDYEDSDTLFFSESLEPELVVPGEASLSDEREGDTAASRPEIMPEVYPGTVMQSTGGEQLKDIFTLAKLDIIEHTRFIPYG